MGRLTRQKTEGTAMVNAAEPNSGLSEYERNRLENMQRNQQFLMSLGLSVSERSSVRKLHKPATKSRSKSVASESLRRSSRVTKDRLISEIRHLRESGNTTGAEEKALQLSVLMDSSQHNNSIETRQEEQPHRPPAQPIPIRDCLLVDDGDVNTIELTESLILSMSSKQITSSSSARTSEKVVETDALDLREEDVVKVTPYRITAVCFHPSSHSTIAVAGDKAGHVSIWNADSHADSKTVFRFRPHISNVAKLEFVGGSLFSTSYDGTIRMLDSESRCWTCKYFAAEEELSTMSFTDSCFMMHKPDTICVSRTDGRVVLIDFRTAVYSCLSSYQCSDSKISSVEVHPLNSDLIVTGTSRDGIRFHDLRMMGGRSKGLIGVIGDHSKSVNAAYFSPNGRTLVSVSLDNTVRAWQWSGSHLDREFSPDISSRQGVTLRHNNCTGRWLSTFRPAFDPKQPHNFVLGSMEHPRRLEIFSIRDGSTSKKSQQVGFSMEISHVLQHDFLASVNSRNCFHPVYNMILGGNSSGRVHLFR